MNTGWLMIHKIDEDNKDLPNSIRVNLSNVKMLSVYEDKLEIYFNDLSRREFYFSTWRVQF